MTENSNNPSVSSVMARFASEGSANGLSLGSKAGYDAWLASVQGAQSATASHQGAATPSAATAPAAEAPNLTSEPLPPELSDPEVSGQIEAFFQPAANVSEYQLGRILPDADIATVANLGETLKGAGVPAWAVPMSSAIVDRAEAMSDIDFDVSVLKARSDLIGKHGEAKANEIISGALSYFSKLAGRDAAMGDVVDALCTDVWSIETAARLAVAGKARRA